MEKNEFEPNIEFKLDGKVVTHVCFVLDESGSIAGRKNETIEGFNEYLESLLEKPGENYVTLTKFNNTKTEIVYNSVPVQEALLLNKDNYTPDGFTPLYDAIGVTIAATEKKLKDNPGRVLFVILTDGQENSSTEYKQKSIFKKVTELKKSGWTFVYIGVDIDAWEAENSFGIAKGNIDSATSGDYAVAYSNLLGATEKYYIRASTASTLNFFGKEEEQEKG